MRIALRVGIPAGICQPEPIDTSSDHLADEASIGSSRRRFLKSTGAATAASLAFPAIAAPRSPGETVRLALIGCGGRGNMLAASFAGREDAVITHLCDLLDSRLESSARAIAQRQHGKVPKKLKRVEELPSRSSSAFPSLRP